VARKAPRERLLGAGLARFARDLSARTELATRWRDAGLWSLEIGGTLGWRSLFVGAGYQPPAEWDFEGRPVEVTAVPLVVGWRPELWRRVRWRLRAQTALWVERVSFQRLDQPETSARGHWDVGVSGGLTLAWNPVSRLEAGARAALLWFPDGRQVTVVDGPSARFNRLALQLCVFVAFGGR